MAFNYPPFTLTMSIPFNHYNDLHQHIDLLHQTLFRFSTLNKQILMENETLRRQLSTSGEHEKHITPLKGISGKVDEPMMFDGSPVSKLWSSRRTLSPLATIKEGSAEDSEQHAISDPAKIDRRQRWDQKQWRISLHGDHAASGVEKGFAHEGGPSRKTPEKLDTVSALAKSSAVEGEYIVPEENQTTKTQTHDSNEDRTYNIHASFDRINDLSNKIRLLTRGANIEEEMF